MKLISWNVNGFRAVLQKGFLDFFQEQDADIFCLQETKMQPDQLEIVLPGYHQYWHSANKKGYSGTAIFSKQEPLSVTYDIGDDNHVGEGRVITLEFSDLYVVTVYTPNAQDGLARLPYRMEWDDAFRHYLGRLKEVKPVVVCGDLNVAHQEIDLKNPKSNRKNAGFSDEERAKFIQLLSSGYVDTFRYLYPDVTDAYTWWSYMFKAREKNAGWRIDYFLISKDAASKIQEAIIYNQVMGSDHCPVGLILK